MTERDELGPADLRIGGLSVWVHGYEYPDEDSGDDADWLELTARYASAAGTAATEGPIARGFFIDALRRELRTVLHDETYSGDVEYVDLEPNLAFWITLASGSPVSLKVEIASDDPEPAESATPEVFEEAVEAAAVEAFLAQLDALCRRFPPRG